MGYTQESGVRIYSHCNEDTFPASSTNLTTGVYWYGTGSANNASFSFGQSSGNYVQASVSTGGSSTPAASATLRTAKDMRGKDFYAAGTLNAASGTSSYTPTCTASAGLTGATSQSCGTYTATGDASNSETFTGGWFIRGHWVGTTLHYDMGGPSGRQSGTKDYSGGACYISVSVTGDSGGDAQAIIDKIIIADQSDYLPRA